MPTQKKIDTVAKLANKVAKAKSIVFANYKGLKHKQLEELRKLLKKVEGEFVVVKNRLMLRSLDGLPRGEESNTDAVKTFLSDSSAALFAYADEVSPIKELMKFFASAGAGSIKGGFLSGNALDHQEVARLAQLPSADILRTKFVANLNAPIQRLHDALSWNINRLVWALNGIKNSKS